MSNLPMVPMVDSKVLAVEAAIRILTDEQWEAVRERLKLCDRCGRIDAGDFCCYESRPGPAE